EFETFRMRGHEEASGTDYVPKEALEEWALKDPVLRFEKLLLERGVLSADAPASIRAAYRARIDALVDEALDASDPASPPEALRADVFAPSLLKPAPPDPAAEAEAPGRPSVAPTTAGRPVARAGAPRG